MLSVVFVGVGICDVDMVVIVMLVVIFKVSWIMLEVFVVVFG